MAEWASPEDVERAAEEWTPYQIACRLYRHPWRPHNVVHRPGSYTITQRCPQCRARRWQNITEAGYPITRWHIDYTNADGYLLHGMGRVGYAGQAVLRIINLRTLAIIEEPE